MVGLKGLQSITAANLALVTWVERMIVCCWLHTLSGFEV